MVEMILVPIITAFISGVFAGGIILGIGYFLGARASEKGLVTSYEDEVPLGYPDDEYFDRAQRDPGEGGLEFSFPTDEELEKIYVETMDEREEFDPVQARTDQLRGMF